MSDAPISNDPQSKKIGLLHLPAHPFWVFLCRFQQWRDSRREHRRKVDAPRLTTNVRLQDVTIRSAALGRDTQYRVMLPAKIAPGTRLPVVYLLHPAGDDYRGWSNDADIAQYAARGLILVMPDGRFSHYVNPVTGPRENYDDFITQELRADVERRFPAATERPGRAIVGLSMGGFGSVHLALAHPDLYAFAASISAALDIVELRISIRKLGTWIMIRRLLGPMGGEQHNRRNPLARLLSIDPAEAPFFYISCGDTDHLLPENLRLVELMKQQHIQHESHIAVGSHNWDQWNSEIPLMFQSLMQHLGVTK